MKKIPVLFLLFVTLATKAQLNDSLNTAKDCSYMKPEEQQMIYEINLLRSDPPSYLQYIQPLLTEAREKLKKEGKGFKNYSLTFSTTTINGKEKKTVDTTWHYVNQEEVRALESLVKDLKNLEKLSILQPDSGIYKAATKHANDQDAHQWKLMHTGSDGSSPFDRVTKYAPAMYTGNENIAGKSGTPSPREIVILLLIDSGIPGYGHRYTMLNKAWTHVACVGRVYDEWMSYWIQNFGAKK